MNILKKILQWILAAVMVLAGVNHFLNAGFYLRMMPPYLPSHLFLVQLSGVFEILLGAALLIPKFTRFAAFGLVMLFVAVFPANIYMAQHPEIFPEFSQTALYLRLPIQFVLIIWAAWYTKRIES